MYITITTTDFSSKPKTPSSSSAPTTCCRQRRGSTIRPPRIRSAAASTCHAPYLQFTGRVTKPIEYCVALYRGFATVDVLNVFANINFDKRAQFRFGYFRVPYTYELYKVDFPITLQPEPSATGDIEGVIIPGAQSARSLTVLLLAPSGVEALGN